MDVESGDDAFFPRSQGFPSVLCAKYPGGSFAIAWKLAQLSGFESASASEVLAWAIATYGDAFAIATSFQKEGMVIVDLASRITSDVRVFTIDTGRLPDETYRMMETVRQRYGIRVEVVFPERDEVEQLVTLHGPNLFYSSVQSRERCCG